MQEARVEVGAVQPALHPCLALALAQWVRQAPLRHHQARHSEATAVRGLRPQGRVAHLAPG